MTAATHHRLAARTHRMRSSAIRELLKVTEQPEVISFAGGMPAPELFPLDEVAQVGECILRTAGATALQYGATEGYMPLRALIAERMAAEGVPVGPEHVLITTGSQQGIDLIGKILLDPGSQVVVESPTYLAALQAWHAYEAEFISVPGDDDGMVVEAAGEHGGRPALIYALPNFQNPRGVTLSLERRERLVANARRHGVVILEDDPYHDLRFAGEHLPRLIALDAALDPGTSYAGGVVTLGSFSKILAPGLRVGWVVAAPPIIRHLTLAKQGTDLHTSMLDQMIAFEMLRSGYLDRHIHLIRRTYRERRDVMLHALAEQFPAGVHWTRPEGGMFLWLTLPPEIDAAEVLDRCLTVQVAFVPGHAFHAGGSGRNTLRLNFSNASPELIREGIRRLRRALDAAPSGIPVETPRAFSPQEVRA